MLNKAKYLKYGRIKIIVSIDVNKHQTQKKFKLYLKKKRMVLFHKNLENGYAKIFITSDLNCFKVRE